MPLPTSIAVTRHSQSMQGAEQNLEMLQWERVLALLHARQPGMPCLVLTNRDMTAEPLWRTADAGR